MAFLWGFGWEFPVLLAPTVGAWVLLRWSAQKQQRKQQRGRAAQAFQAQPFLAQRHSAGRANQQDAGAGGHGGKLPPGRDGRQAPGARTAAWNAGPTPATGQAGDGRGERSTGVVVVLASTAAGAAAGVAGVARAAHAMRHWPMAGNAAAMARARATDPKLRPGMVNMREPSIEGSTLVAGIIHG